MVGLRLPLLLLCLLLVLPVAAQARLTLGWVKGAAILGSEDQARRLAAYLESRLAEPVVLRQCTSETQLHEWLHRYRMVDLAPLSQEYLRQVPAGQLLAVADLKSDSAAGQLVLRQGLRSDQQLQLRTVLANLPEESAGRDLLAGLGGLRLSPPVGAPRAGFAAVPAPAPAERPAPPAPVWPDEVAAARPLASGGESQALPAPSLPEAAPPVTAAPALQAPAPAESMVAAPQAAPGPSASAPPLAAASPAPLPMSVSTPETAPVLSAPQLPAPLPPPALPVAAIESANQSAALEPAELVEVAASLVPPPKPAPAPDAAPIPAPAPRVAALPPQPAPSASPAVAPRLSEETVSRSLSSGRQPADAKGQQTIYLVPFTTIMVPPAVAEAVFDRFVETLNDRGVAAGYEFVILKDDLDRVDPAWLRKATYVTGEIFGYVEESGCCSTDIRSKSRLALYRPGSSEPKLRHEYPAQTFFDHDYSTLGAERQKLAERISRNLSDQLLKALVGG
jgi:hypothetical protein